MRAYRKLSLWRRFDLRTGANLQLWSDVLCSGFSVLRRCEGAPPVVAPFAALGPLVPEMGSAAPSVKVVVEEVAATPAQACSAPSTSVFLQELPVVAPSHAPLTPTAGILAGLCAVLGMLGPAMGTAVVRRPPAATTGSVLPGTLLTPADSRAMAEAEVFMELTIIMITMEGGNTEGKC
eukprot:gene9650-9810_t